MTSKERLERFVELYKDYTRVPVWLNLNSNDLIDILEDAIKDLEVLDILKKYRLIGNMAVQEVGVSDINGSHIEYELRYDFITEFISKEEYEVLKEWLNEKNNG